MSVRHHVRVREASPRSAPPRQAGPYYLALGACALSTLLIVHLTIRPYTFTLGADAQDPLALLIRFWQGASDPSDIINNYVLFMPFGLSLSLVLIQKNLRFFLIPLLVLGAGASLSLLVELTQLFLPGRTSTRFDVMSNSVGSVLGWGIWVSARFLARSPDRLLVGTCGYLLLMIGAIVALPSGGRLSNWDPSYPLLVGNERTGDRPWRGQVLDLQIADRALTPPHGGAGAPPADMLVAHYTPAGSGLSDLTGNLPDLAEQQASDRQPLAADTRWLSTHTPVPALSARLIGTSEFTIVATVASATPAQSGPARIVSLSDSPSRRNFTLGQDGDALVFRLRTPSTGQNGVWPELRIPDVFESSAPRQIWLTYDGRTLLVFIDGALQSQTLHLFREWDLVALFVPPEIFAATGGWLPLLSVVNIPLPAMLVYLIIFVPAGFALAQIWARWYVTSAARPEHYAVIGALAATLVVLFQVTLSQNGGQPITPATVVSGLTIAGVGFALFHKRMQRWVSAHSGAVPRDEFATS